MTGVNPIKCFRCIHIDQCSSGYMIGSCARQASMRTEDFRSSSREMLPARSNGGIGKICIAVIVSPRRRGTAFAMADTAHAAIRLAVHVHKLGRLEYPTRYRRGIRWMGMLRVGQAHACLHAERLRPPCLLCATPVATAIVH